MSQTKMIQELSRQIASLEPTDQVELLRRVLTPEMELRLVAEDFQRRTRAHDPHEIEREVDEAVREVRRQRERRKVAV